jgi:hypothetical protein
MNRRVLLLAGLGLALGQSDGASSRPKAGDLFVRNGDAGKTPLTPGDIQGGVAQTLAWPMDPDGTVRSVTAPIKKHYPNTSIPGLDA